jgi:hypothetical protein
LCVPVEVLGWQQSVVKGPSSFQVLIVASPARWSRGGACRAQGRVPCISCMVALPPVFITLLLLLQVAPACHADPSGLPGARMWRLLPVTLDVTSSWLRSRGACSWVRAKLLVSGLIYRSCFIFLHRYFLCV